MKPTPDLDLDALQALLDGVPQPLEPLDVSMLDGYLTAIALQPKAPPPGEWLRWVLDSEEGRAPAEGFNPEPIRALAMRRLQQLDAAIRGRQWWDPWVFEPEEEDGELADPDDWETVLAAVYPWVAGFALGADSFPKGLMACDEAALLEGLAGIYQFLDPEDLEDADALLEAIEGIEPAANLEEAIEHLVAHSLLLADVSRPRKAPTPGGRHPAPRGHRSPASGRSGRR
ncbi:YecA/YgfB family protein [Inhella gelatinilytica]|uniref:YecA family protein n=1 Tax=Inhella gelatinilytica TaxID=2795030 RepID=A0A931IY67_9BURK|nr:YecA family protein [Inhella gelatinilytica]MBH9552173.1 YecA family protein [Inhella gelatinilytica]